MIWLKNKNIKNFSKKDQKEILDLLTSKKIEIVSFINKSPTSLVLKGKKNKKEVIIKVYHPDFMGLKAKNEKKAIELANKLGVITPKLNLLKIGNYFLGLSNFINQESFLNNQNSFNFYKANLFVIKLIKNLRKKNLLNFGPLINKKKLIMNKLTYLGYLYKNFNFFINKIEEKKLLNKKEIKNLIKTQQKLFNKLNSPKVFYFSHGDLSLKHLYLYKGKIGVIDWSEGMFLDNSLDYAVWWVRNYKFNSQNENKILKLIDLDRNFFKYHLFTEGLIQDYYQERKNLKYFLDKYHRWIKILKI